MGLQHLQQQLDQYARLHGIKGGMAAVTLDGVVTVYESARPGSTDHLFSAPANDIGVELARRIGLAMDRRCA